jgi:hypothetical protein
MDKIDLDHFEKIFALKMLTDEEFFASVVDVADPDYFKDAASLLFSKTTSSSVTPYPT